MRTHESETRIDWARGSLGGIWTEASEPSAMVALAHGAGNDMRHPFFRGIAGAFAGAGISTLRFNFPYAEAGRRSPDTAPVLVEAWRGALTEARRRAEARPVVASGKSLGGRMASMAAAEDGERFEAAALVFFGCPLHAPGRADRPRDAHLPSVRVPMLFIQGTQDPLARLDLVQDLVSRLGALARLHMVDGGDHSFRVRGAKRPDEQIGAVLGDVAAKFVRQVAGL